MSDPSESAVDTLKRLGWGGVLAFFHELPLEEVKRRLGPTCDGWGLEEFAELRQEAKRQKLALDLEENQVAQNPSSGYKDVSWVPQTGHANLKGRTPGIDLERARQLLPRVVWPTRQARRMRHAQEDAQREKIEEDERNRQITKLVELLKKAELLPEDDQRVEAASVWMMRRHAMGRRANTLRAHVRLGTRLHEFSAAALGKPWFQGVGEIMDYIAGRLEEPCGKSVPQSIFSALKFLEASLHGVLGSDPRGEHLHQAVRLVQVGEALGDAQVERHHGYPSSPPQVLQRRRIGRGDREVEDIRCG